MWVRFTLQSLRYIFGHIFGPTKDNLFCPVFVFRRGISNGISDFILYFKNEGLNISWVSRGNPILVLKNVLKIQCSPVSLAGRNLIFLKYDGSIRDLGGKFRQKRIYLFGAFWSLIFKFLFKRRNHEGNPQSKCTWISALHNSLLKARISYILSR